MLLEIMYEAPKVENNWLIDHMWITFELCTSENSSGVGYWELNTSLLNNENFCKQLKKYIREDTTE